MQIVTPISSASALIRFSPSMQASRPNASSRPFRLPNIAITFGTPAAAARGSVASSSPRSAARLAGSLKPVVRKSRRALG
jgi:hypothetical protein